MFKYVYFEDDRHAQPHQFGPAETAHELDVWRAAVTWCEEQFGPKPELEVGSRWYYGAGRIFFAQDNDAFHFRMRWC